MVAGSKKGGNDADSLIATALPRQDVLPFPPTPSASVAGRTVQDSIYRVRSEPRRLPPDAPNILIVLIDDAGPAMPSPLGGEVNTPTFARIKRGGVAYNRFHTTAMCSPTRGALLTGRNHHPHRTGPDRRICQRLGWLCWRDPEELRHSRRGSEELRLQHILHSEKWHNTPATETSDRPGPFENWPAGLGFEYFYGFLAGEASHYEPNLVRNTTQVPPPKTPEQGYHLSEDLADDAIAWLRRHEVFQRGKPFFMYWASGAIHGPHHVHKEWADRYQGKFDDGWDAYRERVFKRAKESSWIPEDAQLKPLNETLAAWECIPER